MDLVKLLEEAREAGVLVELVEGELQIEAVASQKHWLEKLRPYKGAIVEYLVGVPTPTLVPKTAERATYVARPLPVHTLPRPVGEYVSAASQAIGCDPAFIAIPLLASLARAIGASRVIQLKQTWNEPAILWAAIIGKSGTHKTPAMQAAMAFIDRRQAKAVAEHGKAMLDYGSEKVQYDRAVAAWKRGDGFEAPPNAPVEPVCSRLTTTDCTIEALAALLAREPDGMLVTRDELSGWLGGIGEYKGGRGGDLGHWLACWSAQPLTVDRKTGPVRMIHVPRAAVSLVGGIQPEVLRKAIGREHMHDGLCARLLLAMPDARPVVWTDATVDSQIELAMDNLFDRLLSLQPLVGEAGEPLPEPLSLTPEAKDAWVKYFNRHRKESAGLDDNLAAAWSKLEAYTARLALVFQLCLWAAGDESAGLCIDSTTINQAIELSDWFGNETRRVYGLFDESDEDRSQRELTEWIARQGGRVTARELQRTLARYRPTGTAEAALAKLVQAGYARREVVCNGNKPRTDFVLHIPQAA